VDVAARTGQALPTRGWVNANQAVAHGRPSHTRAASRLALVGVRSPLAWSAVLAVMLVMIVALQHPLARAIGTESATHASTFATVTQPAAPSAVAALTAPALRAAAGAPLPNRPPRNPFVPLLTAPHGAAVPSAPITTAGQGELTIVSHAAAPPAVAPAPGEHAHDGCAASYEVRAGDSLWSIAASHAGVHGVHATAIAWHAIYASNRSTIGGNPGLLLPGERLCLPSP
jgi:nucleoid-associated protein YgaU